MKRVDEIDRFVVPPGALVAALPRLAAQGVGAVKHRVASLRLESRGAQQQRQRHPGPATNGAPPFDAVMAGDLGACRELTQLLETVARRLLDESVDAQAPFRKPAGQQFLVFRIS